MEFDVWLSVVVSVCSFIDIDRLLLILDRYWVVIHHFSRLNNYKFEDNIIIVRIKSMSKHDESVDEFEVLGDELLMYSFSDQFDGKYSPKLKNKKQADEKPKLQFLGSDDTDKNNFLEAYTGKKSGNRGTRGKVMKIGDVVFKSNF